jgi:hypothetical protein
LSIKERTPDPGHGRVETRFHDLPPGLPRLLRRNGDLSLHRGLQTLQISLKINRLNKGYIKHSVAAIRAPFSAGNRLGVRLAHYLECLVNGGKELVQFVVHASLASQKS